MLDNNPIRMKRGELWNMGGRISLLETGTLMATMPTLKPRPSLFKLQWLLIEMCMLYWEKISLMRLFGGTNLKYENLELLWFANFWDLLLTVKYTHTISGELARVFNTSFLTIVRKSKEKKNNRHNFHRKTKQVLRENGH